MAILLSYSFKLYPNKKVEARLSRTLELCRWTYNKLLELNGQGVSERRTQAYLVDLKKHRPELNHVYSKVLQMVDHQLRSNLKSLEEAKRNGKKAGHLRFKSQNRYHTLNYN